MMSIPIPVNDFAMRMSVDRKNIYWFYTGVSNFTVVPRLFVLGFRRWLRRSTSRFHGLGLMVAYICLQRADLPHIAHIHRHPIDLFGDPVLRRQQLWRHLVADHHHQPDLAGALALDFVQPDPHPNHIRF